MPIRREHLFFYPIDWPQLSAVIRFQRAKGRCEVCARPHGQRVFHLGDGRWWDREESSWRDGAGRFICLAVGTDDVLGRVRTTRGVLATGHRDHDTAINAGKNLAAFCQRCNMNHDRPEGRPEDTARNEAIASMLRSKQTWAQVIAATGCSRSTLTRISKRLKPASSSVSISAGST